MEDENGLPPPDVPPDADKPEEKKPYLFRLELFLQVEPPAADDKRTLEEKIRYAINDMLSDMMINIQHRFDIEIDEGGHIMLKDNPERAARFTPQQKLHPRPN